MSKPTCVLWGPGLAISGTMLWSLADWQEQSCSKGPWGWKVVVESGSIVGTIWFSVGRTVISSFLFATDLLPSHISLSVQFSSVTQSCPTLCDPMNRSTPGLPVHHQLPEFTQTHIHQVSDAIQPSHPLLSPSPPPPAPNPSLHQSLFQWVNSLHEVAKVLEFQF